MLASVPLLAGFKFVYIFFPLESSPEENQAKSVQGGPLLPLTSAGPCRQLHRGVEVCGYGAQSFWVDIQLWPSVLSLWVVT